ELGEGMVGGKEGGAAQALARLLRGPVVEEEHTEQQVGLGVERARLGERLRLLARGVDGPRARQGSNSRQRIGHGSGWGRARGDVGWARRAGKVGAPLALGPRGR